ncbi:hypothetical protein SNE40_001621 [Patella caerulea]|uniref:Uncharacterized protein n=1 Tax=Patella caerulea TaxID=87958 RepID=A0AAN8KI07_PATCE
MADAIFRSAGPDQSTPKGGGSKKDDPIKKGTASGPSTSKTKNGKAGKATHSQTEEITSEPLCSNPKGDNSTGSSSCQATNKDDISATLLKEFRNLSSSVNNIKKDVWSSITRIENKRQDVEGNRCSTYEYESDSSDYIEPTQVKVRKSDVDIATSLAENFFNSDEDDNSKINSPDRKTDDFDVLTNLKSSLAVKDEVGDKIDDTLASIVTNSFIFKNKSDTDSVAEKIKKYRKPANCPALKTPEINKIMWDIVSPEVRSSDCKLQRVQTAIIKSAICITECLHTVIKQKSSLSTSVASCITQKLGVAIALSSHASREIILRRKSQ